MYWEVHSDVLGGSIRCIGRFIPMYWEVHSDVLGGSFRCIGRFIPMYWTRFLRCMFLLTSATVANSPLVVCES